MPPSAPRWRRAGKPEEGAMAEFFTEPRSWVAIAFVVFFVLFGKKLWTVVRDLLDQRAETVRAELAEAQRLRTEAEAMLRDARTRRETALADAQKLLEGADGLGALV